LETVKFGALLQLISRNFGHANCEVGWEFGNYKHEIIKLLATGQSNSKVSHQIIEIRYEIPNQVRKQVRKLQTILTVNFKN
jgi:hypothetical protein